MPEHFTFDNPNPVTFTADAGTRTIRGLALPYGDVAQNSTGKWAFGKGSLTWNKVKVLDGHDWNRAAGTATLEDTDEGLVMAAKIARGARGDEVLALAEDGVYDGLSIGIANDVQFTTKDGVHHVTAGTVLEVSLTPIPAFERAAVTSVAASAAPDKENNTMEENETQEHETPVSFSADDVRTIIGEELTKAFAGDAKRPIVPAGRPEGGVQLEVREEPLYRFDGAIPGRHDFAKDITAGTAGDAEAYARVMKFMGEQLLSPAGLGPKFIDTSDTAAVNPARYRPDMFLDEGPAQPTPLYEFFYKGGLSDVSPFFYSRLGTYEDLLADHTEGQDPEEGTFTTETGATVTPAPISGQVFVTREVDDQGGNPQVSGLLWSKFQRVFRQMLEAKTYGILAAGTYDPFATIAAGAAGEDAGAAIEGGVVDLQFKADGARFRKAFGHVELYKALIAAKDGNDRKLYPIINPANADGQSGNLYGHINVAGMRIDPTWSLGATGTGQKSYVADPQAVHVWNSGLTKLARLQETVAGYYIGAWAYFAGIVYDASGVLELTYDSEA